MIMDLDFLSNLNNEISMVLEKYKTIPMSNLADYYGINFKTKNILQLLLTNIFKENASSDLCEWINNKSVTIKTIKLDRYGKLKESMSFPCFRYCELAQETWENSSLRNIFLNKLFAFVVFQGDKNDLYINKVIIWKMPNHVLEDSVKNVWETMHNCLTTGKIVKYIDDQGRYHTFFPSSSDNPYVHVRPHALNRNDTFPLPVQDSLTGLIAYPKHSFWLNRNYILKIINEE